MQHLFQKEETGDNAGHIACSPFIRRRISESLAHELATLWQIDNTFSRRVCIFWLVLEVVSGILWIAGDAFCWHDAIIVIGGICFLFGTFIVFIPVAVVNIFRRKHYRKVLHALKARSRAELGIPEHAIQLEVLHPDPRERQLCLSHRGYLCGHVPMHAFVDGDNLCLADDCIVLAFPLPSLHSISQDYDWAKIHSWLQKKHPQTRHFRKFKVKCLGSDAYLVRFHTITIRTPHDDYALCLPDYELERFTELTGFRRYETYNTLT